MDASLVAMVIVFFCDLTLLLYIAYENDKRNPGVLQGFMKLSNLRVAENLNPRRVWQLGFNAPSLENFVGMDTNFKDRKAGNWSANNLAPT